MIAKYGCEAVSIELTRNLIFRRSRMSRMDYKAPIGPNDVDASQVRTGRELAELLSS
jgi:hypothetical protein